MKKLLKTINKILFHEYCDRYEKSPIVYVKYVNSVKGIVRVRVSLRFVRNGYTICYSLVRWTEFLNREADRPKVLKKAEHQIYQYFVNHLIFSTGYCHIAEILNGEIELEEYLIYSKKLVKHDK